MYKIKAIFQAQENTVFHEVFWKNNKTSVMCFSTTKAFTIEK